MALDLSPGAVFAGDFRIVRPLSEGGMGSVFVVEQLSTGAQRALKLMRREIVADPGLRERFLQEARVGARIPSDHVVQVIGAGIEPSSGTPWLVMELLQGEEIEQRVKRAGPVHPAQVAEIARQLAHALGAAHGVGVVHRDLKPGNLFLATSRTAGVAFSLKVLDFGIAKIVEEAQTTGTMGLGTPLWMAPEQTERKGYVGPGTDVWAVGLITFYLLTGKMYWLAAAEHSTGIQTLLRELLIEPIVPPSRRAAELGVGHLIPPGFDAWFLRCLERDPERRQARVDQACAELCALLASSPPRATAPMAPTSAGSPVAGQAPAMPTQQASPLTSGPWTGTAAPVIKSPPPATQPSRRSVAGLGIGLGVLILAGGGVALFLGRDKKRRKKSDDDDDDNDDDDRSRGKTKGTSSAVDAKAADCLALTAFKVKSDQAMEGQATDTPDEIDATAKKVAGLAKDAKELELKSDQGKKIGERLHKSLTEVASSMRGIATAIRTSDTGKAATESARATKAADELTKIDEEISTMCPGALPPEPDDGADGS